MSSSATLKGARGAGVTVAAQALTVILQFIGQILLARLLMPEDYGLLAIVAVLMGIGALIRDFGMGTASLQERELDDAQTSNLFWVNAALTGGTAILLALSAPIVATLFGDHRLNGLVPVMAVVLLITGLQTQYKAKLARDLRFTTLAIATPSSVAVGLAIGVLTALLGWGYWALAVQQLATAIWILCFYLFTSRWMPSKPSRTAAATTQIRAGVDYGLANILSYLADNVDTFMIGLRWGPGQLGYYNRAFQLFMQPITAVFGPLTWVVVPTINRLNEDRIAADNLLLRVQSALVGLVSWALLVTAITADWLIPLLLGQQWEPLVTLLQILALGGIFKALSQINYWAYIIARQSRHLLYSNLVTKPIQILLVIGAAMVSVDLVAWAYVAGRSLAWPINLLWLARSANQKSGQMLWNGVRILMAAITAYTVTRWWVYGLAGGPTGWHAVLIGSLASTFIYFGIFIISPGGWREVTAIAHLGRRMLQR